MELALIYIESIIYYYILTVAACIYRFIRPIKHYSWSDVFITIKLFVHLLCVIYKST